MYRITTETQGETYYWTGKGFSTDAHDAKHYSYEASAKVAVYQLRKSKHLRKLGKKVIKPGKVTSLGTVLVPPLQIGELNHKPETKQLELFFD
jgi:hypothetical protein